MSPIALTSSWVAMPGVLTSSWRICIISSIEKSSIRIPSGLPLAAADVKLVSKYAETVST
jgi:hypothetical protein